MATTVNASGTFRIGGDLEIHRLGFGAMRITGPNIWGPPADVDEALRVLRRLPELGVDIIDTADSYGPYISEELIHEALYPYEGIAIATKGGLVREGPNGDVPWPAVGRPKYLQQEVHMSKRRLGVDRIDLWQLHRIDREVPREDQFRAIKEMQDEGHIRHLGLSNVTVDDVKAAQEVFEVTTVQNRYNVADRTAEDVLEYCEQQGIGFIPWAPLDVGELGAPGGAVAAAAEAHGATNGQVGVAWLLARSPVMLPIPGTGSVAHLEENVAAANLRLDDDEFAAIHRAGVSA
jgi:pyridoxine 4-dehydrogenase